MFSRRKRARAPRFDQVDEGELAWIETQVRAASAIAVRYGVQTGEGLPSMDELSAVAAAWMTDDDSRIDVNALVNALGIATGEQIRRCSNLTWVIATDEDGSDLALHGEPHDVLIYPANAVSRRVVDGDGSVARSERRGRPDDCRPRVAQVPRTSVENGVDLGSRRTSS